MLSLVVTTFVASLMGSLHCAGMCGAFAALASTGKAGRPQMPTVHGAPARGLSRVDGTMMYNIGRGATYITLGATAGAIGAALDLGGRTVGLNRAAAAAAGALLATFGLLMLLRTAGVRLPRATLPKAWVERVGSLHRATLLFDPRARALAIGVLTPLLPCGWLYAFVATAGGTGDAASGALVMLVFWSGTLPMMLTLGAGLRRVSGSVARGLPVAAALALIVTGVATAAGRIWLPAAVSSPDTPVGSGVVCNGR